MYKKAVLNKPVYDKQGKIKEEPIPVPKWENSFYDIDSLIFHASRRILNAIEMEHDIISKVMCQITDLLIIEMKNLNSIRCGEREWVYRTERPYDFRSVIYALGSGVVGTLSYIKHKWSEYENLKHHGEFWWKAKLNIYYSDIFEKPYMMGKFGIDIESDVPFAYYHYWNKENAFIIEQSWVY